MLHLGHNRTTLCLRKNCIRNLSVLGTRHTHYQFGQTTNKIMPTCHTPTIATIQKAALCTISESIQQLNTSFSGTSLVPSMTSLNHQNIFLLIISLLTGGESNENKIVKQNHFIINEVTKPNKRAWIWNWPDNMKQKNYNETQLIVGEIVLSETKTSL